MSTKRTIRGRAVALATAVLTVLALAGPAAALDARSWPVAGQGPGNTSSVDDTDLTSPVVRWGADATSAQRSFGNGALDLPLVVAPSGVLVRTAVDDDEAALLVGLSADDGSVLWELGDVARRCMPAVDSQGRLWVLRSPAADGDIDVPFVQHVDPSTGQPVAGTSFALDSAAGAPDAQNDLWCWGSSLHLAGSGANETLIVLGNNEAGRSNSHVAALNISGAAPSLAWTIDADDADYERILAEVPGNLPTLDQPRAGAFTNTHWLLPVLRNGEPHLARISLATGALESSVQLPVLDDDGDSITDTDPWSAQTMIVGDTVVVSLRHLSGFGNRNVRTMIHGRAVSDLSERFQADYERRNSTAIPGANLLAAGPTTVAHDAGLGDLHLLDVTTGMDTAWSGSVPLRRGDRASAVTFLAGSAPGLVVVTDDSPARITRFETDGTASWRVTREQLAASGVAPESDDLMVAAAFDGELYVVEEGRIWAIGQDASPAPPPTGPVSPPSAVGGWPVSGQGPDNANRAGVQGPSDPGIKWFTDLEASASLSFDTGPLHAPVLHPDGVLVRRADAGTFEEVLVGISASDGSVLWELDDIARQCMPAVDSQDRLWVLRDADAVDDIDVPFIQQVDALNGQPVDGTTFALDPDAGVPEARNDLWCWGSSLHIAGSGANEVLIVLGNNEAGRSNSHVAALNIAGAAPSLAWTIDADDADYERILAEVPGNLPTLDQPRAGAFTDSHWLLPVLRDGEPHLARISLSTGALEASVQIPVLDDDGNPATGTNPWAARTLIAGDTVVVSLRHIGGFGDRSVRSMVHGISLSNLSVTWSTDHERRNSTADAGATTLAYTGSNVAYNAGLGTLFVVDAATGTPTAFSGDIELRELGAAATTNVLADSSGNLYTVVSRDAGSIVRISPTGQEQWRFSNTALDLETGLDPGTNTQLALIDGDGTLVLFNEGRMYAIDSSGGLEDCVLPFDDVDVDRNVHAANICRLVQLGITGGTSPTTYDPTGNVTRAQMASFLARALNLAPITNPGADAFPDVDPNNVHAANINAIRAAGITQGRADGTYDPSGTVTRAEMASFLARAADLDPVPGGTGFTDVDPTNVHTPNIYAVRDAGITTGVTSSTFDPTGNVRRDQMASFLIRMLDVIDGT